MNRKTQVIPLLGMACLLFSCKLSKYHTTETIEPYEQTFSFFVSDHYQLIVHRGDQEYIMDSTSLSGSTLFGRLRPLPPEKRLLPGPDTTSGEHPWTGKKPYWMRSPHLYIRDSVDFPIGMTYFNPEDVWALRTYKPGKAPDPYTGLSSDIGGQILGAILKGLVMLPFAALTHSSGQSGSSSSSYTAPSPRGDNSSIRKAKVRTFPKQ